VTKVFTKYGAMSLLEADQVVSRSVALYGEWAQEELDFSNLFIKKGAFVLDVGAFIGTHTLAFSNMVRPSGKVFSFEPRKEIYAVLTENVSENCENVIAKNIGLGSEESKVDLQYLDTGDAINFGGLDLDDKTVNNALTYQVKILTIDSLDLEKIDFIKIDVEGMEYEVLAGAIKSISKLKPVIFCECNSVEAGSELLNFCDLHDYKAYGFLSSAYNPNNFNEITENIFGSAKELALLLIPKGKIREKLKGVPKELFFPINKLDEISLLLLHKPQ